MIVEIKKCFNSRGIVSSELAEVTLVGRRFHMSGAANTKARLPTVESLTGGSTRRSSSTEVGLCPCLRDALYTSAQSVCILFFAEPAISEDWWVHHLYGRRFAEARVDKRSRRIQDRLELAHQVSRKADQQANPIIQPGMHQCDHNIWRVVDGTERRIWRSWRSATKHRDTVRCNSCVRPLWIKIERRWNKTLVSRGSSDATIKRWLTSRIVSKPDKLNGLRDSNATQTCAVTSHVGDLPPFHDINVKRSGRLPSSLVRPIGSLVTGMHEDTIAKEMVSLILLIAWCLPILACLHTKPCNTASWGTRFFIFIFSLFFVSRPFLD